MLARTMTAKQRLWLSHVKAVDASDGSIANICTKSRFTLKDALSVEVKLSQTGFIST